jgi:murein DD-endopeptidase MepM/ murein hydrolase activator NlpD
MRAARAILTGLLGALSLLACIPAHAGDEDPRVVLRLSDTGDGVEARADNRLAGPVEVLLSAPESRRAPAAMPALPARAVLPAYDRRVLTRLQAMPETALQLRMVPGSPNAKPRDVEYGYPLGTRELRITQGWGGQHSHRDAENRHAVDFAVDEGTPVLAARAGTVMDIESGFSTSGRSATDAGHANYVRILHDDGTMALYAHLKADGVRVRIGQHVRRGDAIGLSGNTGFSAGPHLHFVVQVNRGLSLESIPFHMFGPQGILRFSEAVTAPAQPSGDAASQ